MRKNFLVLFVATLTTVGTARATSVDNPFGYFNAYSTGDIGQTGGGYRSTIQGVIGVAGNARFTHFSGHGGGPGGKGYALHVGGDANLRHSQYTGSVEAGGNLSVGKIGITGNISSGGNISSSGGATIGGNASAAGSITQGHKLHVSGTETTGAAYSPAVDHAATSNFFTQTSSNIGTMATTGTVTNQYGQLQFQAQSGVNVVNVDAQALHDAWGFKITGPADAIVYINVNGESASLDSTNWNYAGGLTAGDVLLNYSDATSLDLSGGNNVNILAPNAETNFWEGILTGSLITNGLNGEGSIHLGHFEHGGNLPGPGVPEPLTILSVLAGTAGLGSYLKRRLAKA